MPRLPLSLPLRTLKSPRLSRGLTLTELMVALGLFVIGMVGVIALFASGVMAAREAQDTVEAATLLDAVLEDIDAHFLEKYRPVNWPTAIEGVPAELWDANGKRIPPQASEIVIPPSWPGRNDVKGRGSAPDQLTSLTYWIVYEALPNTSTPAMPNRPQCLLARVVVYWTRANRTFRLEGQRVIHLP